MGTGQAKSLPDNTVTENLGLNLATMGLNPSSITDWLCSLGNVRGMPEDSL